jgi:hypothetical protein
VEEFDKAFDEFLAAGLAPWIVKRNGASVDGGRSADLPAGALPLDLPRLDAAFAAPLLSGNSNRSWFLPDFMLLADADPAFRFDVVQRAGEVTPDGKPVNQATLALSLRSEIPANLKQILAAIEREGPLSVVPDLHPIVTLSVPVTAQDGSVHIETTQSSVTQQPDGTYLVTFTLSQGAVGATFERLTDLGGATLELSMTYSGWQTVLVTFPVVGGFAHPPALLFQGMHFQTFGDGSHSEFEPVDVSPGVYRFFPVTARYPPSPPTRSLPLELSFATDRYRAKFRITTRDGHTRPIIDANDLSEFATVRSEYRELTSLGDVQAQYPSLRRLYLGQVSGTVVALPVNYGIVHGALGLSAECDSIVDPSSNLTGSRFHFTFTIAPVVDPIDLAKLAAALPGAPEAAGRSLRLTLPDGLDPRHPSVLNGFPSATTTFADGITPHTVRVSVDIADDRVTPAITNVNLFLAELAAAGQAPLFANMAVRLDDVFGEPVQTQATLNLHQTAESDELSSVITPGSPPTAAATNKGPFDLALHRFALLPQLTVTVLNDKVLAAGQSTTLSADATGAISVAVARSLVVPNPIPKKAMLEFVTFNTQTVQQVQHPLTVHAAINFTTAGITAIDVAFSLTEAPTLPVPPLTLTASHTIDFVNVLIPIDSAVTGLDTTVTLNITTSSGQRTVTVSHDFVDDPTLTITNNTIT